MAEDNRESGEQDSKRESVDKDPKTGASGTAEGDGKGKGGEGENGNEELPQTLEDALALVKTINAQLADAKKQIKRVNAESAERRKLLEQKEQEAQERDKSKLTAEERAKQEREALEKRAKDLGDKLKAQAIAYEIARHAAKFGFVDPDDAAKLVDMTAIEYNEDEGTVGGVEDAVKALAAKKPHLLAQDKQPTPRNIDARNNNKGGARGDDRAASRAARFGLRETPKSN